MLCIKSLLLASLRFASLNIFQHQDSPHSLAAPSLPEPEPELDGDFTEILNNTPGENIHSVLHDRLPATFKHGIFEKDRNAIEAIHRTNPTMATKLLAAARYDLIRRQNGNLTTSPTITTTAAPTLNPSGDVVLTSTNSEGSTFVTTFTPGGGVVTSVDVFTSTAPNGAVSTYTSYATISKAATSSSGSASTEAPKLQNAATKPTSVTMQGMLVLALSFSLLLI